MRTFLVLGLALACGGNAAPINGLYRLTETVTASNCPGVAVGAAPGDSLTVTTAGNTAAMSLASINGTCPGQIDGQHVTWSCTLSDASGTVTLQVSATFTDAGVNGTVVVGGSCQISAGFVGTRQ